MSNIYLFSSVKQAGSQGNERDWVFIGAEKRTLEEDCWAGCESINVLHGTEAKTFGFFIFSTGPKPAS